MTAPCSIGYSLGERSSITSNCCARSKKSGLEDMLLERLPAVVLFEQHAAGDLRKIEAEPLLEFQEALIIEGLKCDFWVELDQTEAKTVDLGLEGVVLELLQPLADGMLNFGRVVALSRVVAVLDLLAGKVHEIVEIA